MDLEEDLRRAQFRRSLSERWRKSGAGETVERLWFRLRQATLRGNKSLVQDCISRGAVSSFPFNICGAVVFGISPLLLDDRQISFLLPIGSERTN